MDGAHYDGMRATKSSFKQFGGQVVSANKGSRGFQSQGADYRTKAKLDEGAAETDALRLEVQSTSAKMAALKKKTGSLTWTDLATGMWRVTAK